MNTLFQGLVTGIAVGLFYGLTALGFVLIYKATGIINVAQGGLLMFGAFVCYTFSNILGFPFWLGVFGTLLTSFLFGFIIERLLFRPMIGQPILAMIMMTIAFLSIIEALVIMIWGVYYYNYPQIFPKEPIRFGSFLISHEYLWGMIFCLGCLIIFTVFFRFTRTGICMRAVSEDQKAAQASGVEVKKIFSLSWAIGTTTAAVGGIILGMISMVYFGLSFIGLKALPIIILGGMESFIGAVIGGIIIGVLENMAGIYLEKYFHGIKDIAPFIILMLILIVRPYGLFGLKRIERI